MVEQTPFFNSIYLSTTYVTLAYQLDAAADAYVRAEACGALVLSATTKDAANVGVLALIASSSVNQVCNFS